MTTLDVIAVDAINRFVYDLLLSNGAIGPRTDYGGKTPIIPSQQEPEFTAINKPFLVYTYTEGPPGNLEMILSGTAAYAIYSGNTREINKIMTVLREGMKHFDDTARAVNNYKWANTVFRDILFTSVSIGYMEGPGPAESEGGRHSGVVMIRYSYSPAYNITVPTTMT